jgi:hypothetical protein
MNALSSKRKKMTLALVILGSLGLLFSGVSEAAWVDGTLKDMVDGTSGYFDDMTDAVVALAKLMAATGIAVTGSLFVARKLGWRF